jgi:TolB-like protein/DNA-binding winged helix-turn-helix (wHTH) protein/Flp pilus assembly protein TadD
MKPKHIYEFGPFRLDATERVLLREGKPVLVPPKDLETLLVLVESRGHIVEKNELLERVWPGTFVEEGNLAKHISNLRQLLGAGLNETAYIETIPKRGYRFVAPVRVVRHPAESETALDQHTLRSEDHLGMRFGGSLLAGLLGGGLLLGVFLTLNVGGFWRWLRWESNPAIRSLAVLPLENLSGDPAQEYFADGMTDALITDLSKISALRVISRTSAMHYKGTKKSLPEIARELNVDGVVEGSVMRSGKRVRITAQLLQAGTDQHLWAETYERDLGDVLKLQSEVAQTIAQQVRIQLTPQQKVQLGSVAVVNPEAYEAYLRGRYFWNQRTEEGLWKSAELFQHAIDIDPNSALPYAGLADFYLVIDSWTLEAAPPAELAPKARAAVQKALQLDPTLAEARTVLAGVKHGDWDWNGAGAEYRRAIELNPNYAHAHDWYSQYLCELGQFDEGVAEADRAHALDPLDLMLGIDVGIRLYWARRYSEAIAPIQKTLELDPNFRVAHRFLGQVYEQNAMYDAAIVELRRAAELSDNNPIDLGALGHVYAVSGQHKLALQILEELHRLSVKRYVSGYEFALIYAGLGEQDKAVYWLDKAFQEHSTWMLHLKVDPRLDPLRSDPGFQDLVRRVGLSP